MDRITRVRIRNVRAIESVDLEVSPLTVLIGENGSGKSTIIECLELLRKAADPRFIEQFYAVHHGMAGLLRKGATTLELGVVVEDDAGALPRIEYGFALRPRLAGAVVHGERLRVWNEGETRPLETLRRRADRGDILNQKQGKLVPLPPEVMEPDRLSVASFGALPPQKAIERLLAVLRGIEVHLSFDTLAAWATQSVQRPVILRGTALLFPADRITLLGHNLASAWFALKNMGEAHWQHTMALLRLGLGDAVDSVNTVVDPGGGHISLALKRSDLPDPIPAAYLSDGQLSWLAFVALARLSSRRSLLAVDEPELHLHPSLLGRVVSLLANLDGGAPVVISTHSDRVLELLDDPAGTVRICSLEGSRAVVSRIDAKELPPWLEQFGDLGQLRASGYLPRVLAPPTEEPSGPAEADE
jgi:predicted ATPase